MSELKRAAALLATLTLVAVTGCGRTAQPAGTSTTAPGVATLRSAAATATAQSSAPAGDDARPLVRPDMTGEEAQRLYEVWGQCLHDNGVPVQPSKVDLSILQQSQYAAAVGVCASKRPETWQDRNARTDPAYDDHFRAEVKCIRDHGIKLDTGGDGRQLIVTDDRQAASASAVIEACERQAFSAAISSYNAR